MRLVLVSFVIFFISLRTVMHWNKQNPNSHFFEATEQTYEPTYSGPRREQARRFIASQNSALLNGKSIKNDAFAGTLPRLAVVFVTVKRKTEQYLEMALGSFLMELTEERRDGMFIAVNIGDPNPLEHPFYEAPWLHGLVDQIGIRTAVKQLNLGLSDTVASKAKLAQVKVTHITPVDTTKSPLKITAWHRKATLDYTFALTTCHEIGAPHCLIVEDDVVFAEKWYNQVEPLLRKADRAAYPDKWGYIRLFWAERYFGWESDEVFSKLVLGCISLMAIVTLVLLSCCRVPPRHQLRDKEKDRDYQLLRVEATRKRLPLSSILVVDVLVLAHAILFILAGRNHVYKVPKGISPMPSRGCCTQAIIYPHEVVQPLALHLVDHSGERPYDIMTNRWMESQSRQKLAINPPVLQHIGEGSSRSMSENYWRKQPLWSFAFEKMQPVKK
jgi:hypothetical protein